MPEATPPQEKKTPYQGSRRTFGAFDCVDCNRQWASGNTWANVGQKCKLCHQVVYPHKQWPLIKRKKGKKSKGEPHPENLCGMCEKVGGSCLQMHKKPKTKVKQKQVAASL